MDSAQVSFSADTSVPKLELNKILPNFDPKETNISIFPLNQETGAKV